MSNFKRLRNHKQYTDIENFKKYERSSCIAYELVIRTPKVIDLIKECSEYPLFSKVHNKISGRLSEEYYIRTHDLYLDYHFFEDTNKDNFTLLDNQSEEGDIDIPQEPDTERTYYTKRTELYESCTSYSKETRKDGYIESANVWISPVYARPHLIKSLEVLPSVKLDLSLPTHELTDFIERLKEEHTQSNKVFKSVSELLNDTPDTKQKLTHKGKRVADMLFIYDYVTFKLENTNLLSPSATDIIRDEENFLTKSTGHQLDTLLKYYRQIFNLISE